MLPFVAWWAIIEIFGLAALPLARRIFVWLPDRGYAFSKTAGLLLVSYLLWLGAITGVLVNDAGGILLALLLVSGISVWTAFAHGGLIEDLRSCWKENKAQILVVELLFLLAFAAWTVMRAYAPDKIMPAGGEKFMETAFLNSVLNSPHLPPRDPWMAGYAISYYYFGYVMMAVMVRFSGVAPTIGFDLFDALAFSLTAVTAYGVVSNMVAAAKGSQRSAKAFGLLGALFVVGMGNLEGLLEGLYSARLLPEAFWKWIDIPDLVGSLQTGSFYPGYDTWWWWRASRVLHDLNLSYQPVPYQPIDEFPFFSFLLGDNHPHKLALPFVLLVIGLAFNLLLRQRQASAGPIGSDEESTQPPAWKSWIHRAWAQRAQIGMYLFYAIALGGLAFLNTWDFPVYLGLVLLAYAGGKVLEGEPIRLKLFGEVIALGTGLGVAAILLYIFFYLSFSSQAGGVLPYVFPPTRLPQYLVMFGPFIFILAFFAVGAARRSSSGGFPLRETIYHWVWIAGACYTAFLLVLLLAVAYVSRNGMESNPFIQIWLQGMSLGQGIQETLLSRLANPWLFLMLSALLASVATAVLRAARYAAGVSENVESASAEPGSASDPCSPATLFALLMTFVGLALTLVVEFFYLRDNFGMRMNTIFKFYYQGWVMMACASAYAAWWVLGSLKGTTRAVFATGAALLVAVGLVYPLMGFYSRADGFTLPPHLDAAATFAGDYPNHGPAEPDDWAAIQWLMKNGRLPDGSAPRILEAGSGGYEMAGRISAFTGFPTLLGWTNHEGQWRGNDIEINRRTPVIQTIFTTSSGTTALDLLRQWNVRYVIIGETERAYVAKLCQDQKCSPTRALAKFDQILTPVFKQGGTTVYQVPLTAEP